MLDFMASMISGVNRSNPKAAHAQHTFGLQDRGVDTVRIVFGERSGISSGAILESLSKLVRAVSNLEERLHHSVTLYLLLDAESFVGSGEYTYTFLLVLVPLLISMMFHLRERKIRGLVGAGLLVGGSCVTGWLGLWLSSYVGGKWGFWLFLLIWLVMGGVRAADFLAAREVPVERADITCAKCALMLSIHVPLGMAHFSLAIVSAIFFVPFTLLETETGKWAKVLRDVVVTGCVWAVFGVVNSDVGGGIESDGVNALKKFLWLFIFPMISQ